jgi:hypothetical protein
LTFALVDTTTYLKLARGLHPLLGRTILQPPRICKILTEVSNEYDAKPSLAATFHWFPDATYAANRSANTISLMQLDMGKIRTWQLALQSMARQDSAHFRSNGVTPPSPADCKLLSCAHVISESHSTPAIVISDDRGVRFAAQYYGLCDALAGWEFLRCLQEEAQLTIADVRAIYGELDHLRELPSDWRQNCKVTFGFESP